MRERGIDYIQLRGFPGTVLPLAPSRVVGEGGAQAMNIVSAEGKPSSARITCLAHFPLVPVG